MSESEYCPAKESSKWGRRVYYAVLIAVAAAGLLLPLWEAVVLWVLLLVLYQFSKGKIINLRQTSRRDVQP